MRGLVIGIAAGVLLLDRLTKNLVLANLGFGESVNVVGEYVRLTHVRNTGAAFGLLPDSSTILSVLSVLAVGAILFYYRKIASTSAWINGTLGLLLGGSLGNLFDRITQGYVVDFVDIGIPGGPRYWSFNVADSSIVIAIALLLFLLWRAERVPAGRS